MSEFVVVLVEPKNPGNIGSTARASKNFGVKDLRLVSPPRPFLDEELYGEAFKLAMHAGDLLSSAKLYDSLQDAVGDCNIVVGTSAFSSRKEKEFNRHPISPRKAGELLRDKEGQVALVFGREDWGLYNDELAVCDIFVSIPTSPEYPVLNLSHAVAVLLYEMYLLEGGEVKTPVRMASSFEKKKMEEFFSHLLDAEGYPEHRKKRTKIMFKRLLARAGLSKWEFHTLSGVIEEAAKKLEECMGEKTKENKK